MKQLLPKILTAATYLLNFELKFSRLDRLAPGCHLWGRCSFSWSFRASAGYQLELGGGGGTELVILSYLFLPITAAFSMGIEIDSYLSLENRAA